MNKRIVAVGLAGLLAACTSGGETNSNDETMLDSDALSNDAVPGCSEVRDIDLGVVVEEPPLVVVAGEPAVRSPQNVTFAAPFGPALRDVANLEQTLRIQLRPDARMGEYDLSQTDDVSTARCPSCVFPRIRGVLTISSLSGPIYNESFLPRSGVVELLAYSAEDGTLSLRMRDVILQAKERTTFRSGTVCLRYSGDVTVAAAVDEDEDEDEVGGGSGAP